MNSPDSNTPLNAPASAALPALFDTVVRLLQELLCHDITDANITPTDTMDDLDMDPLDRVELALMIEDAFQVNLEFFEITASTSVQDLVNYLHEHGAIVPINWDD